MTTRNEGWALNRYASVTVDAAAELVNVDTATIRRWSEYGSIEIEWRGDMEVVRLDQVRAASAQLRREGPFSVAGLRNRLEGAPIEGPSVSGLQDLVRDRADGSER